MGFTGNDLVDPMQVFFDIKFTLNSDLYSPFFLEKY